MDTPVIKQKLKTLNSSEKIRHSHAVRGFYEEKKATQAKQDFRKIRIKSSDNPVS